MPEVTAEKNEKIAKMNFGSIYPHYLNRIEKHGRTKEELDRIEEERRFKENENL